MNVSDNSCFTGNFCNDGSQMGAVDEKLVTLPGPNQFVKVPLKCNKCGIEMWHSPDISLSSNHVLCHSHSYLSLTKDGDVDDVKKKSSSSASGAVFRHNELLKRPNFSAPYKHDEFDTLIKLNNLGAFTVTKTG